MIARAVVFAAALGGLAAVSGPAAADDQVPGKKADTTAALLTKLRQPFAVKAAGELRLEELAELVEERHGIPVVINEASFGGAGAVALADTPPIRLPKAKGLSVADALRSCLSQAGATYLVRKTYLEVVSIPFAIRETKNAVPADDAMEMLAAQAEQGVIRKGNTFRIGYGPGM